MKRFELGRSKDVVGNNVTFTWSAINHKEAAIIAEMVRERSIEDLLYHPYGFTFLKMGNADPDIIDYYILISSEDDIPQILIDKVFNYISKLSITARISLLSVFIA